MKKFIILIFLHSFMLQAQDIIKEKSFSNTEYWNPVKIYKFNNNIYFTCFNKFKYRIFSINTSNLDTNWTCQINNFKGINVKPGNIPLYSVNLLFDQNITLNAFSPENVTSWLGNYYFNAQVDFNGNLIDDSLYYEKGNRDCYFDGENAGLINTRDNQLLYSNYLNPSSTEYKFSFVEKLSLNGKKLKRTLLDTASDKYITITQPLQFQNDKYVVSGLYRDSLNADIGYHISFLNENIDFIKNIQFYPNFKIEMNSTNVNNQSNIIAICANCQNPDIILDSINERQAYIAIFDQDGNLKHENRYSFEFYTYISGLEPYKNGFLLFGYTAKYYQDNPQRRNDSTVQNLLIYVDSSGNKIWDKVWGKFPDTDIISSCIPLDNNEIMVAGAISPDNKLYTAILLDNGVSVYLKNENTISISPNPAQDFIITNFDQDNPPYQISIFDINANKIRDINPNIKIDIKDLHSGLYFIYYYFKDRYEVNKFIKE